MNKIEKLHEKAVREVYLDSFDEGGHNKMDTEKASKSCALITKDIAIKYKEFWLKQDVEWFFGYGIDTIYKKRNGKEITELDLFNIFIETL